MRRTPTKIKRPARLQSDSRLLRRLNERAIFEAIRDRGEASRADLTRHFGVSPTTVSRAIAALLDAGLVEEAGTTRAARAGRPGVIYRLGRERVQVVGAALGTRTCHVLACGIDGHVEGARSRAFPTPDRYDALIDELARHVEPMLGDRDTLAVGISMPGGLDYEQGRVLLAPNLHIVDDHAPARDLEARLGVRVVPFHEVRAACIAEHLYGAARGLDDFVYVWAFGGVGAAAVCDGRLVEGHRHLAGELGHITVEPEGLPCGCGNTGCLETRASDAALAREVSRRLGRELSVDEVVDAAAAGELDVRDDLLKAIDHLAIGVAAAINIFNPAAVVIGARMLELDGAFAHLEDRARRRAMAPHARDCRILRAAGDPSRSVIASTIYHLTQTLGPAIE